MLILPTNVPWPSRAEFLDWGMRPCAGPDCRRLLAPAARGSLCKSCTAERRRSRNRPAQRRPR